MFKRLLKRIFSIGDLVYRSIRFISDIIEKVTDVELKNDASELLDDWKELFPKQAAKLAKRNTAMKR